VSTPIAWILDGIRTPFVKAGGAFRHTPVYELGRVAMGEVIARANLDPARIDEVVFGNCGQPPEAANVSRVTALRAGIPEPVPAATVHRNCASGMEAVADSVRRIASGEGRLMLAGGMESMSQMPISIRSSTATGWKASRARRRCRRSSARSQHSSPRCSNRGSGWPKV
jgi:acetyl-CoA C-acetyltransferase/acetyl-CoA acyltransferase